MTEPKHTPGPWRLLKTSWENSLICAEDGTLIAICKIHADVTEDTQDEFEKIKDLNADLLTNAWQLPELRREIAELKAINKEMYEALEAYEKLEADILLNANWNTPSGVPQITQEQFEMLIDCQTIRYNALRKARGEPNL